MQEITITNLPEFLHTLEFFEQQHIARWLFRGHPEEKYKLVPSLFRYDISDTFSEWERIEDYILTKFKREAMPYLHNYIPQDEEEWLALAQHHGLPTRLLDWSMNPLVALFFASESSPNFNADVWCYGFPSTNNCWTESTYIARYLTSDVRTNQFFDGTRLLYPPHISPRITNQSGCFTYHECPKRGEKFIPLEERTNNLFGELIRIKVGAEFKSIILHQLYQIGMHRGLIYPGLDGLSHRIKFELEGKHHRHTNYEYENHHPLSEASMDT